MRKPVIKIKSITSILVHNRMIWHIGFFLLYIATRAIPYYATIMYYDHRYLSYMLLSEIPFILMIYFTLFLYKKLCNSKYYKVYFLVGFICWSVFVWFKVIFQKFYLSDLKEIANLKEFDLFLNSISNYLIAFLILTMCKYFKDNFIVQYYDNQRKQFQIQSELNNLKAQISPHFLFNTMNNFYGLAVEGSRKLPELMVRLSDLMRYSLYETNNQTVPLSSEISYLQNYIELEKIRLEDTLEFDFRVEVESPDLYHIAPLIFIVFLENAFKHAKNIEDDVIKINVELKVSNLGKLEFSVCNNFNLTRNKFEDGIQGLGLNNVKLRLQSIYPNDLHTISAEEINGKFYVKLIIYLYNGIEKNTLFNS